MKRTPINPVSWSIKAGFDQAELIEGHRRLLDSASRLFTPEILVLLEATAVD